MASMVDMLYGNNPGLGPQAPQNPTTGYDAMQTQIPDEVQQIMTPAKSPEEVEQRKAGWMELIQKAAGDPNIVRAMGIMGAQLLNPPAPGQRPMGQIASAMVTGRTAYDFGKEQEYQRSLEAAKTGREERKMTLEERRVAAEEQRTGAQVGLQGAQTRQVSAAAAELEQALPARIKRIEAETVSLGATANYHKALTELNTIKAEIERAYGPDEARAKISELEASAVYKRALAGWQDAHAKIAQQQLETGKAEWKSSGMKVDPDTGVVTTGSINQRTQEQRIVRSYPPLPMADAVQRARGEVDAVMKTVGGSWFGTSKEQLQALSNHVGEPVKSPAEAVQKLARKYTTGGHDVTTVAPDGKVSSRKVGEVVKETAPNAAAAEARARELEAQGADYAISAPPPGVTGGGPIITKERLIAMGWQPGTARVLNDAQGNPKYTVAPDGSVTPIAGAPAAPATPPTTKPVSTADFLRMP